MRSAFCAVTLIKETEHAAISQGLHSKPGFKSDEVLDTDKCQRIMCIHAAIVFYGNCKLN